MALQAPPVKRLALAHGIPVFQPEKLRDGAALALLRDLRPDVAVVVAYGRILPQELLSVPPLGCINVHASLLPRYRGSAPVQWAVLNGDRRTGVTTMYLAPELDAGDVIFSEETEIGEFETSGELFDRLAAMGAGFSAGRSTRSRPAARPCTPQDAAQATFTTQLDKSLCRSTGRRRRAGSSAHLRSAALAGRHGGARRDPVPGLRGEYTKNRTDKRPGSVVSAGKDGIEIAAAAGRRPHHGRRRGKRRMRAADICWPSARGRLNGQRETRALVALERCRRQGAWSDAVLAADGRGGPRRAHRALAAALCSVCCKTASTSTGARGRFLREASRVEPKVPTSSASRLPAAENGPHPGLRRRELGRRPRQIARLCPRGGLRQRRAAARRLGDVAHIPGRPLERLSVEYSHPRWLVALLDNALGTAETEAYLRCDNTPRRAYAAGQHAENDATRCAPRSRTRASRRSRTRICRTA
jgi:methionyl-tRNA formyltransferase